MFHLIPLSRRKTVLTSELEFEIPTWEKIYELLLNLAQKIRKADYKPEVIVGISRGGWPPARIMSDLLELSEMANVRTDFYLGPAETKGDPVLTQPVSMPVKGRRVLVVDDVADTGKSLALVKSHLKEEGAAEVKIATIYYKPWSIVEPDWFERKTTRWIIFPWERKETVKKVIKRYREQGKSVEEAKKKLVSSGLDPKLVERFLEED